MWAYAITTTKATRTSQNCSQEFGTLCTCICHFYTFRRETFSNIPRREMTCFVVVWTTWAYDNKCSILSQFSSLKCWFQFNSRIVRIHFAITITVNNWEMIAETRSHIFTWRSRCRWRRVCLSSLFKIVLSGSETKVTINGLKIKIALAYKNCREKCKPLTLHGLCPPQHLKFGDYTSVFFTGKSKQTYENEKRTSRTRWRADKWRMPPSVQKSFCLLVKYADLGYSHWRHLCHCVSSICLRTWNNTYTRKHVVHLLECRPGVRFSKVPKLFGWQKSLCIFNRNTSRALKLCSYFVFSFIWNILKEQVFTASGS